jgi:ZIP family zinc transporter
MQAILIGVSIPFIGTVMGSFLVFFMKNTLNEKIEKILLGFAAGVMIAASIWSLIIPSINMSEELGKLSFIPASVGFLLGIFFLLIIDTFTPHMHINSDEPEGVKSNFKKSTMLLLAVTIHNIPEGMAVGVVLAGAYYGNALLTVTGALALAIGIAIQNFPEGAIISMPLKSQGLSKPKSFMMGVLSGIVEPIAAILTVVFIRHLIPILPYLLSFAAGAMIYVVVEELIPESQSKNHSNWATVALSLGFVLMMILDVALG